MMTRLLYEGDRSLRLNCSRGFCCCEFSSLHLQDEAHTHRPPALLPSVSSSLGGPDLPHTHKGSICPTPCVANLLSNEKDDLEA